MTLSLSSADRGPEQCCSGSHAPFSHRSFIDSFNNYFNEQLLYTSLLDASAILVKKREPSFQ